jgi:hypothetical protein
MMQGEIQIRKGLAGLYIRQGKCKLLATGRQRSGPITTNFCCYRALYFL